MIILTHNNFFIISHNFRARRGQIYNYDTVQAKQIIFLELDYTGIKVESKMRIATVALFIFVTIPCVIACTCPYELSAREYVRVTFENK